jgi:hypothetical protein
MIDWFVILTPLAVLPILLLFRFIGCNWVFGLEETYSRPPPPPPLTLTWEGKIRDRVGQGILALAPDGADDGTCTATLMLSGGGTVTALHLFSYPPGSVSPAGIWDTAGNTVYYVLGASATLDGPLLNNPGNARVNFFVADGGSFVIFASDLQDMEFLSGNTLTLVAFFLNGSTASAQVVIR